MKVFSRHELIKSVGGYTLVLYVDRQTSEFAEDFFEQDNGSRKEFPRNTLSCIKSYIDENLSGVKIDTVNIMLGSLLVASVAYSSYGAYSTAPHPLKKVEMRANAAYTTNPGQQPKTQKSKTDLVSGLQVAAPNILMLVNKTHSLPSGYKPDNLTAPNVSRVSSSKTMLAPEAAKALEALFAEAKKDGIKLTAVSGYRSYVRQNAIFASNVKKRGSAAAANRFSAKPGQSEHQTGLAMDISSPSVNFALTQSYAQTREGKWLKENAPNYGFIIRYPKGKESITGYQFEPWHIRYVGRNTSLEITRRAITLEEYLGEI